MTAPWMPLSIFLHVSQTKLSCHVIPPSKHKPFICNSQSVHLSTGHLFYRTCFKCINSSCETFIRQVIEQNKFFIKQENFKICRNMSSAVK